MPFTDPFGQAGGFLSDEDVYLFNEGRHLRLFEKLGAQLWSTGNHSGCHFAVWAPNAERVAVIGDFNDWNRDAHPLTPRGSSGIWEGLVHGAHRGQRYKYSITSRQQAYQVEKADPLAFYAEPAPATASIIWNLEYDWQDDDWMHSRSQHNRLTAPMCIYEVHLGSFMRPEIGSVRYRDLAPRLANYAKQMGFTHVQLLPIMEHPFYGSWGYQTTGYFAPTSRYGTPQDLMFFIDTLHQQGIGVILDWVPSHFPSDEHGLGFFDGTHLYEHQDPRQGFHPEWKSLLFNYARCEVQSFLLSSALFWLERYHADGLRVDGVASMLYLDYSRPPGQWVPNIHGGRENLDAVHFLSSLNKDIYRRYPHAEVQTIAEESTAWPQVTRQTEGGLGFGLKWDMGFMHDTLNYLSRDAVYRRYHHSELTFRLMYAYSENFVLALSHDEVVHMKGSLYAKMAGDDWQKRASLRLLFGYMYTQPGKKLLFMGSEFGQLREWNHDLPLDWQLLEPTKDGRHLGHLGLQRFVADLNRIYRQQQALFAQDFQPAGFVWLHPDDAENSVLAYLRCADDSADTILVVCNFTPVPRYEYRVGVPQAGLWCEILNSDADSYGGSGLGNLGGGRAFSEPYQGQPASLSLLIPALAVVLFKFAAA